MAGQEETGNGWETIATAYDELVTPMSMAFAEDVLDRVGLRPGTRFLDVAAGSGALSIPAARLGAQVVATDIAPTLIARLNSRARHEKLSNLEGRVMDGHALELEDEAFDISGSQLGVTVFPDLKRGLSEMVRVTKPGGRVLIVALGHPQKAEFLGFFMGALQAVVPGFTGLPMDPPPPQFQVADPDVLRQRMTVAGLTDVQVETITWHMAFTSAAHFWDMVTNSNPIGAVLIADLTQEQRTEVLQVLEGMLRERSGGSGPAVLNTEVNIAIGTK